MTAGRYIGLNLQNALVMTREAKQPVTRLSPFISRYYGSFSPFFTKEASLSIVLRYGTWNVVVYL